MIINANAKINITLDVLGTLPNGYHEVSMVMQEIDLCDKIQINKNTSGTITVRVLNFNLPTDDKNIAYRAAKLFCDTIKCDDGIEIIIEKNIPVCAGLGGGSADGAAVLKALNAMYDYPVESKKLLEMGLKIGADVPFCIIGKTCHAKGIGEHLIPFDSQLKACVALIKPDADISTPAAYKAIDSLSYEHIDVNMVIDALKNNDKEKLKCYGANVFEYVCSPIHPEIIAIKEHFLKNGAFFSMMSGSGPTVFGLFENMQDAQNAVNSYDGICQARHVCNLII